MAPQGIEKHVTPTVRKVLNELPEFKMENIKDKKIIKFKNNSYYQGEWKDMDTIEGKGRIAF